MADADLNQLLKRWWFLIFCLLCIILAGCGGGGSQAGADETGSGTIQLQLAWPTNAGGFTARQSPSNDVCVDFLIENIRVRVVNSIDSTAASQLWPCSYHSGTLDNIEAGSGYTVEVDGLIGDQVHWYGESVDVTVTAGQNTGPISIQMSYVGNDQTPPTVDLTSPTDQAANIATDTAITIVFNEAVVAASVSTDTITVSSGQDTIAGTVSYDPVSYRATFQPQQELAVNTTYTVKVTTDVMDLADQALVQDYTFSFFTTTVWYVDGSSPSSGTGQSWDEAFNNISDAVTAAGSGDQIWVKAGTYLLSGQIVIDKSVEILSGFAGTETQNHQRDWQALATVVDGNSAVRCFFLSANATIDGFTITRGSLMGPPPQGGGMYIDSASPLIVNCTFSNNSAGPSDGQGGAIYIASGDPSISNCTFTENDANGGTESYGGAIYNYQGGPTISGCTFLQNRSTSGYGNFGGAIYNKAAKSSTTISGCLFDTNLAFGEVSYGGAIYNVDSPAVITGCRFQNNSGGGLYSGSGGTDYIGYGGAIYNSASHATIQNCVFEDNRAGCRDAGYGGAIENRNSSPAITNCSFAANEAFATSATDAYGGGISNKSNSSPTITNSILWDNQAQTDNQIYNDASSSPTVTYCNIDQTGYTGSNNMRSKPRFGAGLHLRADSPCIDKGDDAAAPAVDIDGESRPQSSVTDMGADEFSDDDGDKMADYWEILHGLNVAADDAGSDTDSDLLSNLTEYHLDTDPNSADTVVGADDRGAWSNNGDHSASDKSTPTGTSGSDAYRSFFIFDLSGQSATVDDAAVRLELVNYDSIAAEETLQIWDVTTATTTLAANGNGQTAIYNDLGSGVFFADFDATPTDAGTILDIRLNQEAVNAINAAAGGMFAIGLRLETSGVAPLSFSDAAETRVHQLVLLNH